MGMKFAGSAVKACQCNLKPLGRQNPRVRLEGRGSAGKETTFGRLGHVGCCSA